MGRGVLTDHDVTGLFVVREEPDVDHAAGDEHAGGVPRDLAITLDLDLDGHLRHLHSEHNNTGSIKNNLSIILSTNKAIMTSFCFVNRRIKYNTRDCHKSVEKMFFNIYFEQFP